MEKDFDFNAIGKRMPYRTPEGFFENAMVCGVIFLPHTSPEVPTQVHSGEWMALNGTDAMDLYVRNLTDEELQEWIEFSENDTYYELTTENLNEDED